MYNTHVMCDYEYKSMYIYKKKIINKNIFSFKPRTMIYHCVDFECNNKYCMLMSYNKSFQLYLNS